MTMLGMSKEELNKVSLADYVRVYDKDLYKKAEMFHRFIQGIKDHGYYTYRRPLIGPCEHRALVDDPITGKQREMVMMGSNNYLGLTNHPKVVEAAAKALSKYGLGSGGVPLLSGTYALHQELEQRLARLKGCEDAVLFTSGYAANMGALTALLSEKDVVINDRLNHASIIDGCRLSHAGIEIFAHNNMENLEAILRSADEKWDGKLVVVDGVYSMDGDIAPLPKLVELAHQYKAYLMVDEAHGTGVVGPGGRGSLAHHQVEGQVDLVTITLSKGLGCVGGAVACTKLIAEYLRFYSRSTFFSTSLPPAVVAGAIAAVDVLENEPERVEQLWKNIRYMVKHLKEMGYDTGHTQSAIIPVLIGDEQKLREMSFEVQEAGIYLSSIPYPAVPRGQARFRLSMMATHTPDDMDQALDVLRKVGKKYGILKS
ncbi:MAG: aminotransferase class I/II-fold pyridoxal phosphate-dependent enzyme [Candidatus Omnitrophica bacterium]|nr:aminotransferase class I/II-fold pyridoxal phosphate-dependent enzyme [Candidatus Omnitrophota bacterium]MDD5672191.1 aminotransferase class I/II-fold pyridoxal phosphate-dependent enzyme [Candidatus Omnitrophota bacterium]